VKRGVIWCDRGWMPYHYGFCPNARAWGFEMVRLKLKVPPPYPAEYDGRCTHFECAKDRNACSIVTIRDGAKVSALTKAGMLIHEAMHVWRAMREAIGEHDPSSEFEAYSMQSIAMNLIYAYEQSRGPLFVKRSAK
jgi:hypothetical protein